MIHFKFIKNLLNLNFTNNNNKFDEARILTKKKSFNFLCVQNIDHKKYSIFKLLLRVLRDFFFCRKDGTRKFFFKQNFYCNLLWVTIKVKLSKRDKEF